MANRSGPPRRGEYPAVRLHSSNYLVFANNSILYPGCFSCKILLLEFSKPMKAKIVILPKKAVLDPQGKTVQGALEHMGYTGVGAVHVGKYLEIELEGSDVEKARRQMDEACHKILSNPVIEDYRFEIE